MPPKPPIFRTSVTALVDTAAAAGAMPTAFAVTFAAMLANDFLKTLYMPDPADVTFDASLFIFSTTTTLVMALVTAPLAVLIHRRIILGEAGRLSSLVALRRQVAEFYVAYVALRIVLGTPVFVTAALGQQRDDLASALLGAIVWIAFMYVLLRLFLLFPAIATGYADRTFSSAFRRSRGLVWRFFIAGFVLVAAAAALREGMRFGAGAISDDAAESVGLVASAATRLVSTTAIIAIASRFFIWREEADDPIGFGRSHKTVSGPAQPEAVDRERDAN